MRFRICSVFAVLLLVGSNDARPSKVASTEVAVEEASTDGKDDNSSWRPTEQKSSSVVQSDSRYRGRTENSRKLKDIYYRASFTPGLINSFKTDVDFGLPSDYDFFDSSKTSESKIRPQINDSVDSDKSKRKITQSSRRSNNDRFSKLYSSSIEDFRTVPDNESNTLDVQSDDHNSAEIHIKAFNPIEKNITRSSIKAKNRVVIKPGSIPLHFETPMEPVNLSSPENLNNTKIELKNWPNEAVSDVHDLFNYEKYASNIEGTGQQQSVLNFGDAPIFDGVKKKKPINELIKPITNNNENYNGLVTHQEVPSYTSTESFGPSSEPLLQSNVQEIIQWLQIPPLTLGQNHSHLIENAVPKNPVMNGFDPYNPNVLPITPLGNYYEPQTNRPIQSHSENPMNHYLLLGGYQSIQPNYPTQVHRPSDHYSQFGNYHDLQINYPTHRPSQSPIHYRPLDRYFEVQNYNQIATQNHKPSQSTINYPTSQKPYEPLTHPYPKRENEHQYAGNSYLPNADPNNPNHPSNSVGTSYRPPEFTKPYPGNDVTRPGETITLPTSVVTLLTDLANKKPSSNRRPTVFRPSSEITQNTVVHILNAGSKKPNVTVSEMSVPQVAKPIGSSDANSSATGTPPNVHIMFMNEQMQNSSEKPSLDKVPESPFQDKNCPTIMINSITRVNNTIESKEGCTDLNIVINSQLLSTNVFKPGASGDANLQDKDVNGVSPETLPENNYNQVNTQEPYTEIGNYYTPESGLNSEPDRNDLLNNEAVENEDDTFISTSEVVQQTEITVSTGDPGESAFDSAGNEVSEALPEAGDAVASTGGITEPVAQSVAGDSGLTPVGQAIGGTPAESIGQLPSLPIAGAGTGGGSGAGSSSDTALATVNDDDDDDFDFSPSSLMESMGNVFTYFTFLNPLNYGLFSLAAAPFAAMAAGVLGVAAFLFPWAIPGVLDFGRAADKVTIKFTPSLDDVVNQSIHKYRNWHEWKSKRKKRKR